MPTLSPSKLATYHACPKAYEFRYLRRLPSRSGGSPQLGRTLHHALFQLHNRHSWRGSPAFRTSTRSGRTVRVKRLSTSNKLLRAKPCSCNITVSSFVL
ncbi:MAG: PD-(D/E)XK nuclease family protein [Synechococcaceae cyanobacterium SM2_3_1]|nr:PD-(D/E)XK nuclease family protein [Synechococcaceae cyanobacterium SM2_3_1]